MSNERAGRRSFLRSAGAVLGGFVVIVVLSSAVDAVMHATGVFPAMGETMSDGLFALATAYRVVISVAGCYLAARWAPRSPMGHALALGAVGVAASTAGAVVGWDWGPHWYPLLLIAVAIPCGWTGGALHSRQTAA